MAKVRQYGVQTLSKALYSLDVHAFDINCAKKIALSRGEKDIKEYIMDLKFCYNLKYLAMQKMIKQKHLIFQDMEIIEYPNGNQYLFSVYRNKLGMPFVHPSEKLDIYAIVYSYDIMYPEYFKETNMLEPFFSLRKASKILLNYIGRSAKAVRYMNIDIFNEKNTKKGENNNE